MDEKKNYGTFLLSNFKILFPKRPKIQPKESQKSSSKRWDLTNNELFFLVSGTTFSILYGICPAISAILTGKIVTYLVVVDQKMSEYDGIVVYQDLLLILGIVMPIFSFFQCFCYRIASKSIIFKLKEDTNDEKKIEIIQSNISENFGIVIRNLATLILALVVAFYFNWQLALSCSILVPIIILFFDLISKPIQTINEEEQTSITESHNRVQEVLTGIKTVKMYNSEKFELEIYVNSLKTASKYDNKKNLYFGISSGFIQFMVFAYMGLTGLYGTWLYQNGIILECGDIFTVIAAIGTGAFPMSTFMGQFRGLRKALQAFNDIKKSEKNDVLKTTSSKACTVENGRINHGQHNEAKNGETGRKSIKEFSAKDKLSTISTSSIALYYWKFYFISAIFIILHSLGPPIYAFLNGALFANFEIYKNDYMTEMIALFKFYIIMAFVTSISLVTYTKLLGKVGEKIVFQIRSVVYTYFLNRDIKFYENGATSIEKLVSVLNKDANDTRSAYDLRLGQFVNAILCILLSYGFAFQKHYYLGTLCSIIFFLQSASQFLLVYASIRSETHLNIKQALKFAAANGLNQFSQAICYIIGYWLTKNGLVGEPLVIHKIIQTLLQSSLMIPNAPSFLQEIEQSKTSYKKVKPYLDDEKPEKSEKSSKNDIKEFNGEIEFKNVHLTHPQKPDLMMIKNLNLKIEPGQFVCILSHKKEETKAIFDLLQRFHKPTSGMITIDGSDVRELDPASFRAKICLVEDSTTLFRGTIRENIAYGLKNVPNKRIYEISRKIGLYPMVLQLPQSYDASMGPQLSQPIRRRIGLARALIRVPKILLIDECRQDYAFLEAIDWIRHGITCIIAIEDVSDGAKFDQVVVLNQNFGLPKNDDSDNAPRLEAPTNRKSSTKNFLWDPPKLPIGIL